MPGDFPDAPRRVVVTRGIVNGGSGLRLSDTTSIGEIDYGVAAGLVG